MLDWKEKFKIDYLNKFKYSKLEFDKYKETSHIIYLQQACNKLFSSVENYLMYKYNRKVTSYQQLRDIINNNENDKILLSLANSLHVFFYNGEVYMNRVEIEDTYMLVYNKMKNRLDKRKL